LGVSPSGFYKYLAWGGCKDFSKMHGNPMPQQQSDKPLELPLLERFFIQSNSFTVDFALLAINICNTAGKAILFKSTAIH
jgi:hypothetical protein